MIGCHSRDSWSNIAVPWAAIALDHGTYISGRYWPANVAFKEPSRLTNKEATEILEWWRDRQVSDPANTFKVKRWLESDGSLQAVVLSANHKSMAKRTGISFY